jgi:capsular exopolysaccharide synthesis family protein
MTERAEALSLLDYVRILARHKLLLVLVSLLVPVAALYFALGHDPRYEASAEVLLSRQNLASALTSISDPTADAPPELLTSTQARLARVPDVVRRVFAAAGVERRPVDSFLEDSSVVGEANADILRFTVADEDPAVARALATAYAEEFTKYRFELETASLRSAEAELEDRLAELRMAGARRSSLSRALSAKQREVQTLQALQTGSANVIRRATSAKQIDPRPLRALALSVPLGILLALASALVAHFLDTRVWSATEIARRLRLRLLGRIPDLPRRHRRPGRLVMLHRPRSRYAGVFRVLRANLELADRPHNSATIMFTSAVGDEGKSTTLANLAIALARTGKTVALLDLDLRNPTIARFFACEGRRGFTDVLGGRVELEDVLVEASVRPDRASAQSLDPGGSLRILPAGLQSANLADFAGTPAVAAVLERARLSADVVLVDTPPLLDGGDSIALSGQVDSLVLVTRARKTTRSVLAEARRLLAGSPAAKLGVVVTSADEDADDADDPYPLIVEGPLEAHRVR